MTGRDLYSSAQCRAGRGLLGWSRSVLADRAGLDLDLLERFERDELELTGDQGAAIRDAFWEAGVIAKSASRGGEGVRFRRSPDRPSAGDEPGSRESCQHG